MPKDVSLGGGYMKHSELDKLLRMMTSEEDYILKSLNSPEKRILSNKEIISLLYPFLRWEEQEGTPVFSAELMLPPDKNISISKHYRFIPIPAHQHEFIELFYVYSGSCTQVINGKEIVLKQGEMCILDTNVIHSIEKTYENDIIINCLMRKDYFDTSLLSRLSTNDLISNFLVNAIYKSKDNNNFIIFHSGQSEKLHELVKNLVCEYFEPSICSKEIINCYIILIFSELLQIYQHQTSELKILGQTATTSNISSILEYIEKNYATLSLITTAEHFNFHPNYLSALLKKTTGKSFKEVIHEQKLKKACTLLRNTNLAVDLISLEVGYNNCSFFYKKFKDTYGVTPFEYRQKKSG
jgi:Response regulator containing CheY-like receiver domain and AraC-type DNA-binding domain